MSRKIARRLIVEGKLVCETPVHVGGIESLSSADLTLALDGDGDPYAPGTSVAGPLRAWCRDVFGDTATNALWGWQPEHEDAPAPSGMGGLVTGHASFVTVADAKLEGPAAREIRDHVGIDRETGAAAQGIKFDREILPAGTKLGFRITVDEPASGGIDPTMIPALLHALIAGDIRFGAAKTRGLGKVKLEQLAVEAREMNTKAGILEVLRNKAPSAAAPKHGYDLAQGTGLEAFWPKWSELKIIRPLVTIKVDWKPVGSLMVKAAVDGMTVDTAPMLSGKSGALSLVLPGSSGKGPFRVHAERILATVFGIEMSEREKKNFLEQLERQPLANTLFGARNADKHDAEDEKDKERRAQDKRNERPHIPRPFAGLAALSVDDCFSTTKIKEETWRHMLAVTVAANGMDELTTWEADLHQHKKTKNGATAAPYLDPAIHVAIDRWTGGAKDGALFSMLEPWNFEWEPLMLTLDPLRLARVRAFKENRNGAEVTVRPEKCTDEKTVALAAVALLLLTLQDFANGEIPLGFATTRGMGSVAVDKIEIAVPRADRWPGSGAYADETIKRIFGALAKLDGVAYANGRWTLREDNLKDIEGAWTAYIDAQKQPAPSPPAEPKAEALA